MTDILVSLQSVIPQHGLSRLVGYIADLERPHWLKNLLIRVFCRIYDIDLSEAQGSEPADWRNFNAFFTRRLQADARQLSETRYVQPADGVLSQMGSVDSGWMVQAKGQKYTTQRLLAGTEEEASRFEGANYMTTYLSPRDYHRVHMPISGTLRCSRYVPGALFAVNQRTARSVDALYTRNERLVCFFDTADGEMVVVLIGAVIVAGIASSWAGRYPSGTSRIIEQYFDGEAAPTFAAGEEMGRFYLGSTVVALLPGQRLDWSVPAGSEVRVNAAMAERTVL